MASVVGLAVGPGTGSAQGSGHVERPLPERWLRLLVGSERRRSIVVARPYCFDASWCRAV